MSYSDINNNPKQTRPFVDDSQKEPEYREGTLPYPLDNAAQDRQYSDTPPQHPAYAPYGTPNTYNQTGNSGFTPVPGQQIPPNQPVPPVQSQQKRSGLRTGAILALTLVIVLVFGVGLFAGWQFGHGTSSSVVADHSSTFQQGSNAQATIPPLSSNNIEAVREAVIANVRPAIVQINVNTAQGAALGSGVIIDKRGYIVTNNHVVDGAQTVDVTLADGTVQHNVKVVGTDPTDDLAVVKINPPSNITVAPLGDSSQLRVGQDVLAIGNPLGNTQTVTNGIVSALGRSAQEQSSTAQGNNAASVTLPNLIQTDAPINPGNSGGALVNLQGQLVGIPTLAAIDSTSRTQANGIGFAIPSNRVKFIVPQIIQDGKVTHTGRAGLNVTTAQVDASIAAQDNLSVDHGALIVNEDSNGAAAKAGLQVGDVIVQIDNTQITDTTILSDVLVNKNPGDTVTMKIYRGNQQLTLKVTLGELQAQAG